MKIFPLHYLGLVLAVLTPLWAQDKVIIVSEAYEGFLNENGTGLYAELLETVYQPRKIKVEIQIVPYARATSMLLAGQANGLIGFYAKEDYPGCFIPRWPIGADNISACWLKSANIAWQGETTLTSRSLVWLRGYGYKETLNLPLKFQEVDSRAQIFSMLQKGRAEIYLDDKTLMRQAMATEKVDPALFQIQSVKDLDMYIGFTENAANRKLAQVWDERLAELYQSGELRRIFEKPKSGTSKIDYFNYDRFATKQP